MHFRVFFYLRMLLQHIMWQVDDLLNDLGNSLNEFVWSKTSSYLCSVK